MQMDTTTDTGVDRLAWWNAHLADTAQVQLPTDFPQSSANAHQYVLAEQLRDVTDSIGTSLAALDERERADAMVMAMAVLVHKYTREECFAIGTATPDHKLMVIRIDLTQVDTLADIKNKVHEANVTAVEHFVPLSAIIEAQAKEKNTAADVTSTFQVRVLSTDNASSLELLGHCDLTLLVDHQHAGTSLRLLYNSVLYASERIQDTLTQLEMVLTALFEKPDTLLSECLLVTPAARTMLPDPHASLDDTWQGSVFSFLTKHARTKADEPLIVHGDKQYTYKQVEALSNRLGHFLVSKGIQKEDRVALYAHRSSALVVGIMGILKSGATFTVIDPAYPIERQTVYLEVASPRGIVTLEAAGALNPEVQAYIDAELNLCCQLNGLAMEGDLGPLTDQPETEVGIDVGPDDIGTLSFTSGSTGKPKAVRGRHISLTHFYPWMRLEFGLSELDRFSMLSGIAHDPIQRDVFTPIFLGASIHIPDAEDIMSPGALARWIATHSVTVTHLTPAMGQLLTANATALMPTLRVALFVGDVLTKRDVRRLQRLAPNLVAVNMYGTTETQRAVSFLKIPNDDSLDLFKEVLPAGRGMQDVQLLVLNSHMQQAGVGELAELFVRSPHLSAGYLALPKETDAKFLVNPFSNEPADRMYRTGDLGRYLHNGIVECIGRADDQVKIRGFRIELGEIDTYLGQHPDVRETKTLVMRDKKEEKQIISFFVPMEREKFDIDGFRKYLQGKLPSYAVPNIFYPLDAMPLTPNGKIDKAKLPFPDTAIMMLNRTSKEITEELTSFQKTLIDVWEDALGRPVHPDDNFFEIGGHSILATRVTFQLRQVLKTDMPMNLLYECNTVSKLAAVLKDRTLANSGRDAAESVDPATEVVLDDDIAALGRTYTHGPFKTILLTGATGFLGAFLLRELLDTHQTATVVCHVRAKDSAAAMKRVVTNLEVHGLWQEQYAARIEAVVGDLAEPRLGLSDVDYDDLAERADAIYHNGAIVHWVYPYTKLKAANVQSTVEALRLATRGSRLASVHFVSSTSVFDSPDYLNRTDPILESDDMSGGAKLSVGYAQSKWIAELILLKARDERGLPITIFRPGYVTGDSKTGVMNTDDYLVRLLKGCLQLGKAPDILNRINMCSVDYVARAIVQGTADASCIGKCFHVWQPQSFSFTEYFWALKQYGFKIAFAEYVKWRAALMKLTLASRDNALYPLLHFVLDDLPTRSQTPLLDWTNTRKALGGEAPKPTSELMGVYIAYLVQVGYFPKPSLEGQPGILRLPRVVLASDKVLQRSTANV